MDYTQFKLGEGKFDWTSHMDPDYIQRVIDAVEFIGNTNCTVSQDIYNEDHLIVEYRNEDIYFSIEFVNMDNMKVYLAIGAWDKERPAKYEGDLDQIKMIVPYIFEKNVEKLKYNFMTSRKG